MKNQKKKIIIFISILIIILLVLLLARERAPKDTMPSPPPTQEPEEPILRDAFPVDEPVMSEDEEIELTQVTELKNMSPVSTPDFSIEYSYKTGGFIVKSDLGLNATENALKIWLNEQGFDAINSERFEYQSNKLSL
jgi:hypothetical protein